jgi:hypothetical protein
LSPGIKERRFAIVDQQKRRFVNRRSLMPYSTQAFWRARQTCRFSLGAKVVDSTDDRGTAEGTPTRGGRVCDLPSEHFLPLEKEMQPFTGGDSITADRCDVRRKGR